MFRMMTTSASTAAITGLGTAYATGMLFGPLASVGFAVGSCIGYIIATIFYYRTSMVTARIAFDSYPELMLLHLMRNYRNVGFKDVKMETKEDKVAFQRRLDSDFRTRVLLISAYHTAASAIDEIDARKEAQIIDRLSTEQ